MVTYYAHFQDLVDGYVGPFATVQECDAHAVLCKQRGDGSAYLGSVTELPGDAFVMTAEEDIAWADDHYS